MKAYDFLPESLDRVEFGVIDRQIKWLDVILVGLVGRENNFFSLLLRHFLCKSVEKYF
jgi:hypothetical protein